jgi:DNA-binding NarL/FixJ family response regulator
VRVILAEDSVIVRHGLERLLSHEGHDVVATMSRAETLASTVAAHLPDAVLVDIRMPPTHTDEGLRAAAMLRADHPTLGLLVLSQYVVPEYAMRLLESGERYTGYLLKDRILEARQLTHALERIVAGGTVVDPDLVESMFAAKRQRAPLQLLSDREVEVLRHVAEGLSDKGIAERLFLSTHTVGTHIQHIFQKLGLPDSAAANRRVLAALTYLQRGPSIDE